MFNINNQIASVKIGENYYSLFSGTKIIDGLKCTVTIENFEKNLYSWIVEIQNNTNSKSLRISELLGLDFTMPLKSNAKFNTLRGDDCTVKSFYPESFVLNDNIEIVRSPLGGRSSNTTAFPYFDIIREDGAGIVCGIGWSGQWKLSLKCKDNNIRVCIGQEDCDFVLEPNECARSVRMLMYCGEGGADKLHQNFVRYHRQYYSPYTYLPKGYEMPISAVCFDRYYWGNEPKDGKAPYCETEAAHINVVKLANKCNYFNSNWIDACWFDGAFRTGVGNYKYAEGFNNNLSQIVELAHKNGKKFILWFEPMRAQINTDIYKKFGKDYTKIIRIPDKNEFIVNIGDEEVWKYCFDSISKIIDENKIDVYRQDFNIDPLPYLRSIETPNRKGMVQMRFVEGMYKLWDSLRERFHNLLIDNCASGGRLIDFETNKRAIPLWQSDMSCRPVPTAIQNENLTLSQYIPYHQSSSFDESAYFMRSGMTTGIACQFNFLADFCNPEISIDTIKRLQEWTDIKFTPLSHDVGFNTTRASVALFDLLRLREYWYGDFTPLTAPSDSEDVIVGYSLYLPKEDKGVAVLFRRIQAPKVFTLKLKEIDKNNIYDIILSDENLNEQEMQIRGSMLIDGFDITMTSAPSSMLVFYKNNKI